MKKILKTIVLASLVLSLIVIGNTATSKAANNKANEAYKKFVTQLKTDKQYKDGIYIATMKAGKGEDILLVTDMVFEFHGKKAGNAKVYQYINNKVTYMGTFATSGSDFSLAKSGKYLLVNTLHSTEQVLISNGKVTTLEINGLYLFDQYASKKKYKIVNDKRVLISSKKINRVKAEKQYSKNYKAKELNFKKA